MSSTAARLFLSKIYGKLILSEFSVAKASSQRQLHKLCQPCLVSECGVSRCGAPRTGNDPQNDRLPNRRQFHTSNSHSIVFESKYEIEVPNQDFFSYVLGDIKGYEDAVALVCGLTGRKYTYEKLKDYSTRVGISMLERGYRKGDVIAIYSPNVPEYVFTILGNK